MGQKEEERKKERKKEGLMNCNTVEIKLSGITETASHLDMQKIRIIGFFPENRIRWQFEVKKKTFLQTAILGYIFICLEIRLYFGDDR